MDSIIHVNDEEELLVAELELLGVHYLSRQTDLKAQRARPAEQLMADLLHQPSSRVRTALIALLLSQPAYSQHGLAAVKRLEGEQVIQFKLFYCAAVILQMLYAERLRPFLGSNWHWLPDLFSDDLNLSPAAPQGRLEAVALLHRQMTGVNLNWAGTYESAARQLIRRWELERIWSQSLPQL